MTVLAVAPVPVRAVGLLLTLGYAMSCAYFVRERRRVITAMAAGAAPAPAE
jgi:hypothetical protein